MRAFGKYLLVVAALVAAVLAMPGTASGTVWWTRITTPSGTSFSYQFDPAKAQNTFTVKGQVSSNFSSIDVICTYTQSGIHSVVFASDVAVSNGAFTATAVYPQSDVPNCRLRAVTHGLTPNDADYLGSFTGPVLYTSAYLPHSLVGNVVFYRMRRERGDVLVQVGDAADCGVGAVDTYSLPTLTTPDPIGVQCGFMLASGNITSNSTPTASALRIDGHDAYLPGAVEDFLRETRTIPVFPTAITVSRSRAANGDDHLVERSPIDRCDNQGTGASSDTYPPTSDSCKALVSTGVSFVRVMDLIRGGHQVRVRDTFASTDGHSHAMTLQYLQSVHQPLTGDPGYAFPNHGGFAAGTGDEVVTGLGTKAASILVRSDRYAAADDPAADTLAITWSKSPSSIRFGHFGGLYGMNFALNVPAGGAAHLGFAYSERLTTTAVKALAAAAVAEMINAPVISAPKDHAVITGKRTTVKGSVTAGANGLPTKVTVNGHAAKLTKVSSTKATYQVSFRETYGRHVLTATAYDNAGNAKSRSIHVRNVR